MTQENSDEDILLKLSMGGKSLRMKPQDAPQLPTTQPIQQTLPPQPAPVQQQPVASPAPAPVVSRQPTYQPQRETNTVVPPANTPPQSEEAQEDILRKLTMKPKQYEVIAPEMPKETASAAPKVFGVFTQTPEEARSNKPYVSSDNEVDRVRKLAQNIYGSDMVQNRLKKK